jgi:small-conductance mechanosensitive channel
MASPADSSTSGPRRKGGLFTRFELILFMGLLALLILCGVFLWTTRGAMAYFHKNGGVQGAAPSLVDQQPWQTAQTLATLAVSAEENEFAHAAERLADHEVDQAFAAALRQAQLDAGHRQLSGEALELAQKVAQLEQLKRQDQALVDRLAAQAGAQPSDDLEEAKAQLGLDADELADAQRDLERAAGDHGAEIQDELAAREAAMRKFDSQAPGDGQIAVLSAKSHHTLATRIASWFNQRNRMQLIAQAQTESLNEARRITAEHNALEAKANATVQADAGAGHAAKLANLKDRSSERQILSIDDDRIETEQQLAQVYAKWLAQVQLQHRIVLHLILQSLALIVLILAAMILCTALVRRFSTHPKIDRRQIHTLRSILELSIQVLGAAVVLIVVFGPPQETSTILGLATAALTIALQDYILAFLGWFALMGKNGIRVGDWVEINGVGGEVTGIGLMTTTLLETGGLADHGQPTGRRISFMNGYAIRGQYFNFSTAGQWMWDEIEVCVPSSADAHTLMEEVQRFVAGETQENALNAEKEWKKAMREEGGRCSAAPVVSLRPAGAGIDLQIRYVTTASGRFELRNRLYERVVEQLHASEKAEK